MLSPFLHFSFLHALVASAFVFAVSSLYWVPAIKPRRHKTPKTTKWDTLPVTLRQRNAFQHPVSRNGTKKLAPVADSVW